MALLIDVQLDRYIGYKWKDTSICHIYKHRINTSLPCPLLIYKLIFLLCQPYFSGQCIAIYFASRSPYAIMPETLMFIASMII